MTEIRDVTKLKQSLQVAELYYQDNLSQLQISKQLGVSRPTVSRLIQYAKDNGLVKIQIINPLIDSQVLGQQLAEKYGAQFHVVPNNYVGMASLSDSVGKFAADYLTSVVEPGDVIGIGWGHTIHAVTKQVEQSTLTMKMMESGDHLDLSSIHSVKVDKHSTGGVGDKTSIPLATVVAALGIPVPMISGRGLGHTGGTLDKLEAIPGYQVEISEQDFIKQVKKDHLAIIGATGNIAPADKKIYALRDVTDTVDSIPLIAGSIMSKKIASGTDALVIDVKTGAGAFMKTLEDSKALARALVDIGKGVGMQFMALITDMNQPLGNAIGNSLEIEESIYLLKGNGPADLEKLIVTIGGYMAVMGDKAKTTAEGQKMCEEVIHNGQALASFEAMVRDQGGDPNVVNDPNGVLPQAKYQIQLPAKTSGVIAKIVADEVGVASMLLGGGRQKADNQLDYSVGIVLNKKIGDKVESGEPLLTIYSNREEVDDIKKLLYDNIEVADIAKVPELIYTTIE